MEPGKQLIMRSYVSGLVEQSVIPVSRLTGTSQTHTRTASARRPHTVQKTQVGDAHAVCFGVTFPWKGLLVMLLSDAFKCFGAGH